MTEARRIFLDRDDWIPNNPRLPVLVYRNAVDHDDPDIGASLERLFTCNGWLIAERGSIHRDYHYHATTHEVIGVAAGSAILGVGGPHSMRLAVDASDVIVLPAGTGHARIAASLDFRLVSACPPGQDAVECRDIVSTAIMVAIAAVPDPLQDPVRGPRS